MAFYECKLGASTDGKMPEEFNVGGSCSISMQFEPARNNYLHGSTTVSGSGTVEIGGSKYSYSLSGTASASKNGSPASASGGGGVNVKFVKI